MSKLAKIAALATIIGTLLSIYVYYYDGKLPIFRSVQEGLKSTSTRQFVQTKEKENSYCELLIKEIDALPVADINELRIRHKAAKEIPSSIEESNALLDVVKICLKNNQFDYASNIAKDIPSSLTQSEAYRAIGVALAYFGQLENAINAAKKIPSSLTQSLALKEIATIRKDPKLLERNKIVLPKQQNPPTQKPNA